MTLGELKLYARQMADMENSTFISEPEITRYINDSYASLYDLLIARWQDYFVSEQSFTITAGNRQTLPANFYKLRALDKQISADKYADVLQFMFSDRNYIDSLSVYTNLTPRADVRYRLMNNEIILLPSEKAVGTYRLWFMPRITKLVIDADQTVNLLDFDEYIAIDSALKMLQKEETVNQPLMLRKAEFISRIESMGENRTSDPQRIQDVSLRNRFNLENF